MAFDTPKFMLPIRLGTLNADGAQELFVYALTRKGRVETTNYRTVRLPTGVSLPVHVKEEFPQFYRAMFGEQVKKEAMRAVFLEYAWDMGWCDPCAANPLSAEELRQLGVFWLSPTGADLVCRAGGWAGSGGRVRDAASMSATTPRALMISSRETANRWNPPSHQHIFKGEDN
jgi:hypothetical protein